MADINYTTLLGLALPETGKLSGQWGNVVNQQLTAFIEDAVAGAVTKNITSGDWTLDVGSDGDPNEARMAALITTGTPGQTRNIIAPAQNKAYFVINQTDSEVVVKASGTVGASIFVGHACVVVWDGVDFVVVGGNLKPEDYFKVENNLVEVVDVVEARLNLGISPFPDVEPTYKANFENNGGILGPRFDYSRATESTYWQDGRLLTAGIDVPVFEDGALRLEPQATNVFTRGHDPAGFFNYAGAPGYSNTERTNVALQGRFSGLTAMRLTANSDGVVGASNGGVVMEGGIDYTASAIIYAEGVGEIMMDTGRNGSSGGGAGVTFTPSTGAVTLRGTNIGGGGANDLGGGWWRLWFYRTSNAPNSFGANGLEFFTSSIEEVQYIDVAAIQIEQGTQPTSLIPTSGSPVTRAADNLSTLDLSNLVTAQQGTIILKAALTNAANEWMLRFVDDSDNGLQIVTQDDGTFTLDAITAGTPTDTTTSGVIDDPEDMHTFAVAWHDGTASLYIDGDKVGDVDCDMTGVEAIQHNTAQDCIHRHKWLYTYNQRLSDRYLESL